LQAWDYSELSWEEVREAARAGRVAVQPFGSLEGHGPHLPCGVDNFIVAEICRGVGRCIPEHVVVLPLVPYGFAQHHMDFPGAVDVGAQLLVELAVAVGRSLAHHGFRRLVFVNGHAANSAPLDIAAKRLTLETASICALVDWFKLAAGAVRRLRESSFPGGISHACELETSVMLHLRPELVDMAKAEPNIWESGSDYLWRDLYPPSPVNFMDAWSRISARGVMGDPTTATADKGREIFEEAVRELGRFIEQFGRYQIRPRPDHH